MLKKSDMHDYQVDMKNFSIDKPFCLLLMEMGLGKTVTSASSMAELMDCLVVGRCLIVAPKLVAEITWPEEFQNWEHLKKYKVVKIEGDKKERIAAILRPGDFHIISQDNLWWLVKTIGVRKWPWDAIIYDEYSGVRSQSGNRFKAIRAVRRKIKRLIGLSATPTPNGLHELWAPVFLLDLGERLGDTESAFTRRYFVRNDNGFGVTPRKSAEKNIYKRIKDIARYLKAEDYIKMPGLVINPVWVDLSTADLKRYRKFEKEMIIQLSNTTVDAANAGVLTGKLLQYSNGAMYTDEFKNYEIIHDKKIEMLKEIVESHRGNNVLIAYHFKSDLERIKKAFPKAKLLKKDPTVKDDWNKGKVKIMIAHPRSAGHGLNLQHGGSIIIWFGPSWSLELFKQLIGRLHRQGQKAATVLVHIICSRGTVDERVVRVYKKKDATQQDLLDAVKAVA